MTSKGTVLVPHHCLCLGGSRDPRAGGSGDSSLGPIEARCATRRQGSRFSVVEPGANMCEPGPWALEASQTSRNSDATMIREELRAARLR